MMWGASFTVLFICYFVCLLYLDQPLFSYMLENFFWNIIKNIFYDFGMKFSFYVHNGRVYFFMASQDLACSVHTLLTLTKWSDSSALSSGWHSILHTSHSVHKAVLWAISFPIVFSLPVISVSSSFSVCLYWILFWYHILTSLFYSAVCVLLEFRRLFAFSLNSLSVTMIIL